MATRPYSRMKGDPFRAYEQLPAEVRLALHEPTVAAVECGWAPDVDAAMAPDGPGWLLDPVRLGGSERDRIDLGTKLVSWLFAREEGLRYVLVLVGGVVVLADRTVWGEGRYLGVSLDAALSNNDTDELGTIAALLGAEALLRSTGVSWSIGVYIAVAALVSLGAVSLVKEPKDVDLHA